MAVMLVRQEPPFPMTGVKSGDEWLITLGAAFAAAVTPRSTPDPRTPCRAVGGGGWPELNHDRLGVRDSGKNRPQHVSSLPNGK